MNFDYYIPTKIIFGRGKIESLKSINLPGKKALIAVSSGNSMKKYGYLDKVINLLKENNNECIVFDKILSNPTLTHVMEGSSLAKEENCDFIIGLGGGSSIDSAKSIAIMATNEGNYWDYIGGGSGKSLPIKNKPLPIIAIPTTAGTGTEADPWTVITKEDTNEKIGFGTKDTFPIISIIDPNLMLSIPPKLTAYQGFDALFHATEGYIANIATEISDIYALKSISLIGKYLSKAVNNGNDINARTEVALASTLSGMVESTSSCISKHSLAHALSAYHSDLPHGAALIMISLAYYKHFINVVPDRFINMAKALGKEDAKDPNDFILLLEKLQKDCHVDDIKLSDYKVDKDDLRKYAVNAKETMGGLFTFDPKPLSIEDATKILEESYK
ncbi:MAG: iron-containing alcohol dehydrogenase [Bacilli bacterium]